MQQQLHGVNYHNQPQRKTIYIVNRARHTTTGDTAPDHYNAAVQIKNSSDDEGNAIEGEGEVKRRDEKWRFSEKGDTTP